MNQSERLICLVKVLNDPANPDVMSPRDLCNLYMGAHTQSDRCTTSVVMNILTLLGYVQKIPILSYNNAIRSYSYKRLKHIDIIDASDYPAGLSNQK